MDVIGLLQSKRRCLNRFLEISERFLADLESEGADDAEGVQAGLTGLEAFESRREAAIKTLGLIDKRITEVVRAIPVEERTAALATAVQDGLDEEARLVQSILTVDNRIMSIIEGEKQRLSKSLSANRKQHELTGRFKSTWMPEAGEGLDQEA